MAKRGKVVSENKAHLNKPTFEEVWGDFFLCYRACSLKNFDLVIPYFGLIYAVLSAISCNSHTKQRVTLFPRPSNSFPSFPSLLLRLRRQPLLFACRCCRGNIFNEQHWNLVKIAFVVAKLGNICFESNICVREANMV